MNTQMQGLSSLIPTGAPDAATRLHKAMLAARSPDIYRPVPWPSKPARLAMCGGRELDDLAKRVREGERRGEDKDSQYQGMQDWMLDRASSRATNEQRLRSLLWVVETLEVLGGHDRKAQQLATLMRDYLQDVWRIDSAPRGVAEREAFVLHEVTVRHREAFR